MNFDNYIFRSHMVGKIISLPKPLTDNQKETLTAYRERMQGIGRPLTEKQIADWHSLENKENESKVFKLSQGAKKELTELVMFEKFGRRGKLETKYFTKGIECEKEGRDLLSEVLGTLLVHDEQRKSNEWVTGRVDVKPINIIIDIKNSFSFKSFNNHLVESVADLYLWQMDCYMELWGLKDSLIAFVLVDTPFKLVDNEIRRSDFNNNLLDNEGNVREEKIEDVKEIVCEHIYTRKALEDFCEYSGAVRIEWFEDFNEIPKEERVHLISHSFNPERIEQRNKCLTLAREYMNTVQPLNNLTINKKLFL